MLVRPAVTDDGGHGTELQAQGSREAAARGHQRRQEAQNLAGHVEQGGRPERPRLPQPRRPRQAGTWVAWAALPHTQRRHAGWGGWVHAAVQSKLLCHDDNVIVAVQHGWVNVRQPDATPPVRSAHSTCITRQRHVIAMTIANQVLGLGTR